MYIVLGQVKVEGFRCDVSMLHDRDIQIAPIVLEGLGFKV